MTESYWRDRRVLVTGANGFVGSWLCHRLVSEGARVAVLDHPLTGRPVVGPAM